MSCLEEVGHVSLIHVPAALQPLKVAQCASTGFVAIAGDTYSDSARHQIAVLHLNSPGDQVLLRLPTDATVDTVIAFLEWSPPGVETMLLVGFQDGRILVYSMTSPDRGQAGCNSWCWFDSWHCHEVVSSSASSPLAAATWLHLPSTNRFPSTITDHAFRSGESSCTQSVFDRTKQEDAEQMQNDNLLPPGSQEWVRDHVGMIGVITRDGHLSVYWQSLFSGFGFVSTDGGPPSRWLQSRSIPLGKFNIAPAGGRLVASWGRRLLIALAVLDHPSHTGSPDQYVTWMTVTGDLMATTPSTHTDSTGLPIGISKSSTQEGRSENGSPISSVDFSVSDLHRGVLLLTHHLTSPDKWTIRSIPSGRKGRRSKPTVLHSDSINYASFGVTRPDVEEDMIGLESSPHIAGRGALCMATSPDGLLVAILVPRASPYEGSPLIVLLDTRHIIEYDSKPYNTFPVADVIELSWLHQSHDPVCLHWTPNSSMLMLLVSELSATSTIGLFSQRTALHMLRPHKRCAPGHSLVQLETAATRTLQYLTAVAPDQSDLDVRISEGIVLAYQVAYAISHRLTTVDIEQVLRWHVHVREDSIPVHVAILVINDMVHMTSMDLRLDLSDRLDPFKARMLPLLLKGAKPEAASVVNCLAIELQVRGLVHVVGSRLDILAPFHTVYSHKTLSRAGFATAAEDSEATERSELLNMGWYRWCVLYCTSILLELRLWLSPDTDQSSHPPSLPLLRVFMDMAPFTSVQKIYHVLTLVCREVHLQPDTKVTNTVPARLSKLPCGLPQLARSVPLLSIMQALKHLLSWCQKSSTPEEKPLVAEKASELIFPTFNLAHYGRAMASTVFLGCRNKDKAEFQRTLDLKDWPIITREDQAANFSLLGVSCPFPPDECTLHDIIDTGSNFHGTVATGSLTERLPGWGSLLKLQQKPLIRDIQLMESEGAGGQFGVLTRSRCVPTPDIISGALSDVPTGGSIPGASESAPVSMLGKRGLNMIEALDRSCQTLELPPDNSFMKPNESLSAPATAGPTAQLLKSCIAGSPLTGSPWKRLRAYQPPETPRVAPRPT